MAKHAKKMRPSFSDMADKTIEVTEPEYTPTPTAIYTQENKSTPTGTPTHTPQYSRAHLPTLGDGERKTERLQLVVRPSTKSRLAKYAKDHGTSSNEVVQRLLDELLDEAGY